MNLSVNTTVTVAGSFRMNNPLLLNGVYSPNYVAYSTPNNLFCVNIQEDDGPNLQNYQLFRSNTYGTQYTVGAGSVSFDPGTVRYIWIRWLNSGNTSLSTQIGNINPQTLIPVSGLSSAVPTDGSTMLDNTGTQIYVGRGGTNSTFTANAAIVLFGLPVSSNFQSFTDAKADAPGTAYCILFNKSTNTGTPSSFTYTSGSSLSALFDRANGTVLTFKDLFTDCIIFDTGEQTIYSPDYMVSVLRMMYIYTTSSFSGS